jgi:predicted amino acid-binding ACT domain protein
LRMPSWNSKRHHVWVFVVLRFFVWSSVPTSQSFHIQHNHQHQHHHPTKLATDNRYLPLRRAALSNNLLHGTLTSYPRVQLTSLFISLVRNSCFSFVCLSISILNRIVTSIDDHDSISNKNMPPHDTASTISMMPPVTTTTTHVTLDDHQDATVHTDSTTTAETTTTTSVVAQRFTTTTGPTKPPTAILRIHGPDQKGIVAAFAQLLHGHGCNIVDSEQHAMDDIFFQRISFDYSSMLTDRQSIETGVKDVCQRLGMYSGTYITAYPVDE